MTYQKLMFKYFFSFPAFIPVCSFAWMFSSSYPGPFYMLQKCSKISLRDFISPVSFAYHAPPCCFRDRLHIALILIFSYSKRLGRSINKPGGLDFFTALLLFVCTFPPFQVILCLILVFKSCFSSLTQNMCYIFTLLYLPIFHLKYGTN